MTKKEAGAARNGGRIPSGDGDFDGRFENLVNYAGEKTGGGRTERTLIPPDAESRLSSAYDVRHEAYQKTVGAHSKADREAENNARKAGAAVIRPFVRQYRMLPPVTDVAALKETQPMTRSPWIITLPPEARTNFFPCVPRRQSKGGIGPWGGVRHVAAGYSVFVSPKQI